MRSIFITTIRIYQWCVSPLLGPRCRFYPSCSNYAISCLQQDKVPTIAALVKIVRRLGRCHPAHQGGVDLP